MVDVNLRNFPVLACQRALAVRCGILLIALVIAPAPVRADGVPAAPPKVLHPFGPGEKLVYSISWSNIISAGNAVMEVRKEPSGAGNEVLRFLSEARTTGMLDTFYRVRDSVESVFDLTSRESLSYKMDQHHGKRKKQRELAFDHLKHKATFRENGAQTVVDIPTGAQDALSSLYYLRMSDELVVGRTVIFNVTDSGKNWSVDIHVLAKEKIKTPAGTFDTIKVQTYPKYDGVFMHKGEIFIWLTDDEHRVPVLMKSTITIGSIMATLTEMKLGGGGE